jgi:hypothetical protein
MNFTVVKEGNTLRILDASAQVPDGESLVLYTEQELRAPEAESNARLDLQMASFIRGDEGDAAEDLFDIPPR